MRSTSKPKDLPLEHLGTSGLNVDMTERSLSNGASLSGNERDSVYLNLHGTKFENISGITGLDDPGDGRSFAVLDFDRDGWLDLVVASAGAPALQIYRNGIGDDPFEKNANQNQMIAVRLVGGNQSASPSREWSNRDGYGAVVTVRVGRMKIVREHRAGEGMAAQNSAVMLIGIGASESVAGMSIRWPSGRIEEFPGFPANSMVTLYENPAQSGDGSSFSVIPYRVARRNPVNHREREMR